MDTRTILDQLIGASRQTAEAGERLATDKGLLPADRDERIAMLKGAGAGALAAGAVAMLFGGSKKTRKFSKKALKLGGTAALGGLAYRAFSEWQQQQNQPGVMAAAGGTPDQGDVGQPIGTLDDRQSNARSEAIVKAMIAAARADGHIDEAERAHIERQIGQLGLAQDITGFLLTELGQPVGCERIARLADTPETAAEMYLASVLVIDEENPDERRYLDELGRAMNLEPALTQRLKNFTDT